MKNIFFALIMATSTALFALPSDSSLAIAQDSILTSAAQSDLKENVEAAKLKVRRSNNRDARQENDNRVVARPDPACNPRCICPQGPTGPQGPQGTTGDVGPQGPPGPSGDCCLGSVFGSFYYANGPTPAVVGGYNAGSQTPNTLPLNTTALAKGLTLLSKDYLLPNNGPNVTLGNAVGIPTPGVYLATVSVSATGGFTGGTCPEFSVWLNGAPIGAITKTNVFNTSESGVGPATLVSKTFHFAVRASDVAFPDSFTLIPYAFFEIVNTSAGSLTLGSCSADAPPVVASITKICDDCGCLGPCVSN